MAFQFQSNGKPRPVNVEFQSGKKFSIDTKKVSAGLDSRVERYVQGTSLPTTGTNKSIRNDSEKIKMSDEKSFSTQRDAVYISIAEKYRDGTATEEETEQLREIVLRTAEKNGFKL